MSYTLNTQRPMNYGFIDVNGNKWPDAFVASYNVYNDDLNKYAGRDIDSDSLVDKHVNELLDSRHKHFMHCCSVLNEDGY